MDLGAAPGRRPPGAPQRPHRARATRASICGYAETRITSHTQCWHKILRETFTKGLSSDDSRCSPGWPQAAVACKAFLYIHGDTRGRHRAAAWHMHPGTSSGFAMPRSSTPAPSERRQRARPCPAPPRAASTQQGNTTVGGSIHSAQGTNQPGPSLLQRNTRNPGSHRRLYIQRSRLHRQHTCKVSAMLLS